jgi:DNA polymerase III sliding clamp (beta) subunit (PCNA family)
VSITNHEEFSVLFPLSSALKIWKKLSKGDEPIILNIDSSKCTFMVGQKKHVQRLMEPGDIKDLSGVIRRVEPDEKVSMGMEDFADMVESIGLLGAKNKECIGVQLFMTDEGMRVMLANDFDTLEAVYPCSGKLTHSGYYGSDYFGMMPTNLFNRVELGWNKESPLVLSAEYDNISYKLLLAPRMKIHD